MTHDIQMMTKVALFWFAQEGDVNRRVLLLLDGIDRFLAPGSVLITLLSFLLSKHPGLFLIITSEHTLNKGGDGLLENTPEKVGMGLLRRVRIPCILLHPDKSVLCYALALSSLLYVSVSVCRWWSWLSCRTSTRHTCSSTSHRED